MDDDKQLVKGDLRSTMKKYNVPFEVEPLVKFSGVELVILRFRFVPSDYDPDTEFALMDVVDPDGVRHIVSCGAKVVQTCLHTVDPDTDLPLKATFVKLDPKVQNSAWRLA